MELKQELKTKIVELLNLQVSAENIADDEQFITGDYGIDSIDILEIVLMLDQDYGVKIETKEKGEEVFSSINSLTEFVAQNRSK
ncbi:MAG: phosphopantetheine-binding protein [Spirochaetes bacterium]|jgi:acyl carrier protein|nr:phosphopantetheine-binding protein [Spirochaetota bacterium]